MHIGAFHSATTWPILLLVHYRGLETFHADVVPWSDLCVAVAFAAGQPLHAQLNMIRKQFCSNYLVFTQLLKFNRAVPAETWYRTQLQM